MSRNKKRKASDFFGEPPTEGINSIVLSNLSGEIKLVKDGVASPLINVASSTNPSSAINKDTFDTQVAALNDLISTIGAGEVTLSASVTAHAGGGQALAVILTSDVNIITTVATTGDSVKFPLGAIIPIPTSTTRVVVNRGANAVNVFPTVGGQIDALGVNAAFSVPANKVMVFRSSTTTQYYSEQLILPGGTGDVVGPASSTDNAITRFDSTTGKLVQNSVVTIDDNGNTIFPDDVVISFSGGANIASGSLANGLMYGDLTSLITQLVGGELVLGSGIGSTTLASATSFLFKDITLSTTHAEISSTGMNIPTGSAYKIDGVDAIPTIISVTATLDFTSTAAQTSSEIGVTVTGAAIGDVVAIGIPESTGPNPSNCCYTAFVGATNQVRIRFNNYSSGALDPTSGTFKIKVFK